MKRNTETPIIPKEKIELEEVLCKRLSYKEVVAIYFPNTPDSGLDKILWQNTEFPYTKDQQKIINQIYSYYIKTLAGLTNNSNRKITTMSF